MGRALSRRGEYVERIIAAYRRTIEDIFEVGGLLVESKKALARGEFLDMIERDLPFSISTAERLMKIATDRRIAEAKERAQLPPSWSLLYAMSKLDDDEFAQLSVGPDMTINDVEAAKKTGRDLNAPATTLSFTFPLPPSHNKQLLLNSKFVRMGKKRLPMYWVEHKKYEQWCDNLVLATRLPGPPVEPWELWRMESAEFTFDKSGKGGKAGAAKRDLLELFSGLKWPVDWLVSRGYVQGDSLDHFLTPLPTPRLVFDGDEPKVVVVIRRVR